MSYEISSVLKKNPLYLIELLAVTTAVGTVSRFLHLPCIHCMTLHDFAWTHHPRTFFGHLHTNIVAIRTNKGGLSRIMFHSYTRTQHRDPTRERVVLFACPMDLKSSCHLWTFSISHDSFIRRHSLCGLQLHYKSYWRAKARDTYWLFSDTTLCAYTLQARKYRVLYNAIWHGTTPDNKAHVHVYIPYDGILHT